NYRTSHQIRTYADRLLEKTVSDVDGNTERRDDTISVFNGPEPAIALFDDEKSEIEGVSTWINERLKDGVKPDETGIFVRSADEFVRAEEAVKNTNTPFMILDDSNDVTNGHIPIGSMHMAKGMEFKAVAVMACDEDILPLVSRISSMAEDSDLKEVYDTERHLFYVACTRARENLLITGVKPGSEFIGDLLGSFPGSEE
ncbi:MAG: hypothetical protein LBG12_14625, partial [Synergistaceae bacterium]|nr:hypothetical protein [Synergistaceae bacterium]